MTFTQEHHVAQGLSPQELNGGAKTSDWVSMANHDHVTALVYIGAHGAATTITVNQASDNAGAGSAAMAFSYRKTATTLVDDWGSVTAVSASGVATSGSVVGQIYAVEIDSAELSSGNDFVSISLSNPGASVIASVMFIASRGKIKQNTPVSVQS